MTGVLGITVVIVALLALALTCGSIVLLIVGHLTRAIVKVVQSIIGFITGHTP